MVTARRSRMARRNPAQVSGSGLVMAMTIRSSHPGANAPNVGVPLFIVDNADSPRSARMRLLARMASSRRSFSGSRDRSASACHKCKTPVAMRPSLRRTPARIRRTRRSESSRPQLAKPPSNPSTAMRSERQMPRLQPCAPRQSRRRNWRSGPSGSARSGASRLISLARRARHQSAKVQLSGSSFSFRIRSESARDNSSRLPVTNQPRLASARCAATKFGSRDAIAVEEDAIIAGRGKDRAVADFGEAETVIGMPDMVQAAVEPLLPCFDQFFGLRRRSRHRRPTPRSRHRSGAPASAAPHRARRDDYRSRR